MNLRFPKKYLLILLISIITAICWSIPHAKYGRSQIIGQFNVLWNATPLKEVLTDPLVPDSMKYKLRLVQEIKTFAFDSLRLTPNNTYSTVYNQKGNPLLQNVMACQPYELKDYTWYFPILGEVSYKGFFDSTLLQQEVDHLKTLDLDIGIREVTAWSTLGWFNDPILTNFLNRSDGQIANLIIHELTHGTVYIKDDVYFNENLANFIGDQGARLFLKKHFSKNPEKINEYINQQKNDSIITNLVLQASDSLELLYKHIYNFGDSEKENIKKEFMTDFCSRINATTLIDNKKYNLNPQKLNNTYFQAFRRYNQQQNAFNTDFDTFKDLPTYINYIKKKYN